jgi:DNA adenine methylase
VSALIDCLLAHTAAHSEEYFYAIRARDRDAGYASCAAVEKAARLIYLNKTCYNGLYRVNKAGFFNTPYGAYRDPVICDAPVLHAVHAYLRENDVSILQGDYADAAKHATPGSLVYFDPPYHSPTQRNFTQYDADGFDESDQIALAQLYALLSERGVRCLLSNADTPLMHSLYADYAIDVVTANRAINARATARGAITEVLIRNWS